MSRRNWFECVTPIVTIACIGVLALTWVFPSRYAKGSEDQEKNNLVMNGSIDEAEQRDGKLAPKFWTEGAAIEGVKYTFQSKSDDKKESWLRIAKTANRYFPIAAWEQVIDRTGNAPAITISAKVKTKDTTKAIIDVVFLDSKDEWIIHTWVAYIGPKKDGGKPFTHDWKKYTGTVAIPENCVKIKIGLQDYGPGSVMFDDIQAFYEQDVSKVKDALSMNHEELPGVLNDDVLDQTLGLLVLPSSSDQSRVVTSADRMTIESRSVDEIIEFTDIFPRIKMVNGELAESPESRTSYRTADSQVFRNKGHAKLHAKSLDLSNRYRAEGVEENKEAIRSELKKVTEEEYELIREERSRKIAELEKDLAEAKAALAKRDSVKVEIINRRLEQLLGNSQLYQWNPTLRDSQSFESVETSSK